MPDSEHKNGQSTYELAALRKTIYSLIDLREIMLGCNQRYLAFLSSLDDPSAGERDLQRLSQPRVGGDERNVNGLNFFTGCDQALLLPLHRAQLNLHAPPQP